MNRFCCVEHKNAHVEKEHPESLKRSSQEYLVKSFQKKAKRILLNAQKYKANNRKIENQQIQNNVNIDTNKGGIANKRLHSEMNQQIISSSITITSEIRKILVPAHRSKGKVSSNCEVKPLVKTLIEMRKSSPCDVDLTVVKTSTPITKNQLVQSTPQNSWNISQTSSISNYQTPFNEQKQTISVYETPSNSEREGMPKMPTSVNTLMYSERKTLSTPRSIMSKISKYSNESSSNINPNVSKCRRVTFSFGSTNSSPLESVQEVEICKDNDVESDNGECVNGECVNDECVNGECVTSVVTKQLSVDCIEEIIKLNRELCQEDITKPAADLPSDKVNELCADSSPSEKQKNGFFNCVTNMICSAVPLFASWRVSHENRSKRSRSPDAKSVGVEVIRSPEHKRLRYPFDLRVNPIKARKSISQH